MTLKEGERIDDLQFSGLKIIQHPDGYRFGCDAVELANFVRGGVKDRACDLGSGTGIIAILLAAKRGMKVTGIEITQRTAEMSQRSILLNGLENKVDIINAPMQNVESYFEAGSMTVVVTNPPYQRLGTGDLQETEEIQIARHEKKVSLKEVVKTAAYLLSTGGRFYMIHRADRAAEVIAEVVKQKLEPKEIQFLRPAEGKPPHLIMIMCKKDARPGVKILPERDIQTYGV